MEEDNNNEEGKPDIPLPNWLDPKKREQLKLNKKELEKYYWEVRHG